ncbi:MAG: methylenetetrahydrofolate reductase, partial [Actinomycetota bacterium]|nr:methylenetetrahydrofolate reductase [Actinomycetota bacterium]
MREPTSPARRARVAPLLSRPRIEVLPLPGVADALTGLPPGTTVTVTCSPRRGLAPTVALACELAGRGVHAVPHLAARQV